MDNPDLQRTAELLARHALPLLAAGLGALLLSTATAMYAIRLVLRFRAQLVRAFDALIHSINLGHTLKPIFARGTVLVPSAYLALHLAVGLVVAVAVAVFAAVAEDAVTGGEMAAFDVAFAGALQDERSPTWDRFFFAVSWFGSGNVLTAATVVVAAVLAARGRIVLTLAWTAAQTGGGLLNFTLKETFARTRPEFADPMLAAESWSFPSGHAMGTFILCGLACYLVFRESRSWTATGVAMAVSAVWCVLMAFSRLYLGVHFASDVVAGFLAGLAWVAACISALEVIRRGTVPSPARQSV